MPLETMELRITGMSCDHCVRAVRGALAGVPGVRSAEVDLATGLATVIWEAALPDAAKLLAAVEGEGFQAVLI